MKTWLTILALFIASPALAQTGQPTSWVLRLYATGSPTPVSSVTVSTLQVTCNQLRATTTTNPTNPTTWLWEDPANSTRDCVFADATRLSALPDGSYEGAAVAVNADGASLESVRAPFVRSRPNPPAVPGNPRFTR